MRKIKTVFKISYQGQISSIINEVIPDNQWVLKGEGVATIKFDGTSVLIQDGKIFKRYDAKNGKNAPEGFIPCEEQPDPITGHFPGWLPANIRKPEDKWIFEAFSKQEIWDDGTYELVGPKVNGNKEKLSSHELWKHGSKVVEVNRTFDDLKQWLVEHNVEGLVFHHPDGRMAKIRRKDFGFKW